MIYLIAKPLKGKKANLLSQIEERLKGAGAEYELHVTESGRDAYETARRYSQAEESTIVVVGGDGMLNNVLSGIVDPARCTLGLIPAGTGNDFAECAEIPNGLAALDLILGKEPKWTDYIQFSDGKRSMNIAGLGIDVDILLRCERRKHFHARSKYFLSLLSSLIHYRGAPLTVRANGEALEGNFLLAAVCNGRQFGGGIPICPSADIEDGKLEVVYVDCPRRWKIPSALIKLMKGKVFDLPFAHRTTCEEAEFLTPSVCTAQYDGELAEAETFRAKIEHRKLKMFRG